MNLLERAKRDKHRILTNQANGFAVELTITDGNTTAVISGIPSNHHVNVNGEGIPVNSKKASVTISEKSLQDAGYPVRNNEGNVKITNDRVTYKDSTGVPKTYVITQVFPDETIGQIVLILGQWQS
jgi:hypothetical protein